MIGFRRRLARNRTLILFLILTISVVILVSRVQYPDERNSRSGLDEVIVSRTIPRKDGRSHSVEAHYIWCVPKNTRMELRHELAVHSLVRFYDPDIVHVWYESAPKIDVAMYFDGFRGLQWAHPNLIVDHSLPSHVCDDPADTEHFMMTTVVTQCMGECVFIGPNTVLRPDTMSRISDFLNKEKKLVTLTGKQMIFSNFRAPGEGIVYNPLGIGIGGKTIDPSHFNQSVITARPDTNRDGTLICRSVTYLVEYQSSDDIQNACIVLGQGFRHPSFHAQSLIQGNGRLTEALREVAYGHSQIPEQKKSVGDPVPKISHIVMPRTGRPELDFLQFLAVLSHLVLLRMDKVYIHYAGSMRGPFADHLKHVYPDRIEDVSHRAKEWYNSGRWVDKKGVEILQEQGGLLANSHTIFINDIDKYRAFDCVASLEAAAGAEQYPHSLNIEVMMGKQGVEFLNRTLEAFKKTKGLNYARFDRYPYKIYERNPGTVKIDPHFVLQCVGGKCNSQSLGITSANSSDAWLDKVHGFHFYKGVPPELKNMEMAMNSKTVFGKIAQRVIALAGNVDIKMPTTASIVQSKHSMQGAGGKFQKKKKKKHKN